MGLESTVWTEKMGYLNDVRVIKPLDWVLDPKIR